MHTATLLPDGRVLIAGVTACVIGVPCLRPDHDELYDPATGTFTATGSMSTAFTDGDSAALLNDGRMLLIRNAVRQGSTAQLYDPVSGTFSPLSTGRGKNFGIPSCLPTARLLLAPL